MIRSLTLFVHVVGMLTLFVGLGLEWIRMDGVRRGFATGLVERLYMSEQVDIPVHVYVLAATTIDGVCQR